MARAGARSIPSVTSVLRGRGWGGLGWDGLGWGPVGWLRSVTAGSLPLPPVREDGSVTEREGPQRERGATPDGGPAATPGRLPEERARREQERGVQIRASRITVLVVLMLAICTVPLATARPWLAVLFAIPLAALLWVLRAGVDVDPDGLTVRAVLGRRRVGWAEVAALRAAPRGDLWLVLSAGRELRLPVARARHLPLIAAASGGRIRTA